MRAERGALDPVSRQQAAAALRQHLSVLEEYRTALCIAAYVAVGGEMDPAPLLADAVAAGKRVYLPRVPPERGGVLQFFAWQPGAALQPNRLGIPEPPEDAARISRQELDLVLTPLLGFDNQGHRLGMGGGYYDRSFGFLNAGARKPWLLGLGYEFQHLQKLPAAPWDVALDGAVTELKSYRFQPPRRPA